MIIVLFYLNLINKKILKFLKIYVYIFIINNKNWNIIFLE